MRFYDFIGEELNVGDYVVYLKNTRTGSSTIRKCLYVGVISKFGKSEVKIKPLSKHDKYEIDYLNRDECISIQPRDIVCKIREVFNVLNK